MKVLFVYSGNSSSGKNIIVENQAISLISAGIDIELFPLKGRGFRGYLKNIKKISKLLRQNKFDIIHAHYGLSAIIALLSKRREKLIVSFMGDDLVGTNNINGSLKLWSRMLILVNVLFARVFYNFSIIKSAEMQGKLLRNTPCSLIPNGVTTGNFFHIEQSEARERLCISNDTKIVLFVSNPKRAEKNYSLSEEAVREVDLKEAVLLPVSNVNTVTLNLYYNAADLVLLTSFHEGSPNVVKEAMACGCPVVSTDVGDVKWLFGETPGYYITSFDPSEIAERITLAIDFRKKNRITEGRKRIEQLKLSSGEISEQIKTVYNSVLS